MKGQKNTINRLVAEVFVSSVDKAFKAQNDTSAFVKEKLVPLIEKVADRLGIDDTIIRIDKLELDFGNFNPDGNNEEALHKFEALIEEKLLRIISKAASGTRDGNIEVISTRGTDEELLVFALEHGILPWWAGNDRQVVLLELAEKVLANPGSQLASSLKKLVLIPAARQRIAHRLAQETTHKILALVNDKSAQLLSLINEILEIIPETVQTRADVKRSFYQFALVYNSPLIKRQVFLNELLQEETAFIAPQFVAAIREIIAAIETPTALQEKIDEAYEPQQKNITDQPGDKTPEALSPETKAGSDTEAVAAFLKEQENTSLPSADTNRHFIRNCGIVILSPFLSQFFKVLDLVNNNTFVSDEAAERAVNLVQHLCTGGTGNFEEHDMVLNKILCGYPIYKPLIHNFTISETELDESANLLKAVVQNWTALKNTSPESMRDAFFMREGMLEQQSNGWNLKVEKNTIDVLVDKLPWGVSVIKMPWSEDVIFVDWN